MKCIEISSNPPSNSVDTKSSQHRGLRYQKVRDARKHPVRGLWRRNGRYYAQITVEDPNTGRKTVKRVPLEAASTDPQAVSAYQELLARRRKKALPVLKRPPSFQDYAKEYLEFHRTVKDAKRASTLATERVIIGHWNEHLGHVRLDHITRAVINKYIEHRQAAGRSGRTVNLEVTVLRNVLNKAIDDGWLASLPTQNLRPLKWTPKKRELITKADIDTLCKVALEEDEAGQPKFKNGRQFADYVQLMAFCGSRRDETLRLKWTDVDWERRQLTIGADGQSKNRKHRVVDFNANLHAHLKAMHQRRAPDSDWLFPSPQRGERDAPAKTFVETLRLVREEANLPSFRFHDLRHFFISFCVMSGIDYMTIARWVGHQDGGVLIGKVYGHLSNEHAQQQARRVHFELVSVVSEPAA